MSDVHPEITVTYDSARLAGRLQRADAQAAAAAWARLRARALQEGTDTVVTERQIDLPWPKVLSLLRDFGSRAQQQALGFRFKAEGEALARIKQFTEDARRAAAARGGLTLVAGRAEIESRLWALGFTLRGLRSFQMRDLERLLSLPHGANFSVPGAGKTTVTLALHLLVRQPGQHLLVVAPKSAFAAWKEVVSSCIAPDAPDAAAEEFTVLEAPAQDIDRALRSGATRFLITYDLLTRHADVLTAYLARQPVHLVLDEAHRMKGGMSSQRGAFLLNVAALPVRRDILSGTPMPQGPGDLAAQLGFLWPGQGLDLRVSRGEAPRSVLGELYVRTTKRELGLPPARRWFRDSAMAPGQLALYGIVRSEALRQISRVVASNDVDVIKARRSVLRLLQLSSNPILALQGMSADVPGVDSGIVDQVLAEGASQKMRDVEAHVRSLAAEGRKTVVWTIFTDTLNELERMMADLNPVTLYGAVPSGSPSDPATREGRITRFHQDRACQVMIANPAAAGEGISLHTVCHDAIYLDRSYVSTHYLQSIDRIHRLGLPAGTETNIYIYRTKAPVGLGSIDYSVSRRLAVKIRGLQQLLDDPDLHEVALDEEESDDPVDFDVKLEDLIDLVEELEGRRGAPDDEDGA